MGDQHYDNAIRETRLCLCRGAHRGARTRLSSTSIEPSLPRGLEGGTPPKSQSPFLVVFRKSFYAKLSRVLWQIDCKKPKDRKSVSGPKGRPSHEMAYASGLWQLPHHLLPGGQLRLRGSFLQEICSKMGQRAEAQKYSKK